MSANNINSKLENIQLKYAQSIPKHLLEMTQCLKKIEEKSPEQALEALDDMSKKLHKFIGSSGSYAFTEHCVLANKANLLCKQLKNNINHKHLMLLKNIFFELSALPLRSASLPIDIHSHMTANEAVYILKKNSQDTELLKSYLSLRIKDVRVFKDCRELAQAIEKSAPAVIILNIDQQSDLQEIRKSLKHENPPYKTMVLSHDGAFSTRYEAIECGSNYFELKTLDYHHVCEEIFALIEQDKQKLTRVLLLNDQQEQLDYYSLMLREAKYAVKTLLTPTTLLETMLEFNPEIILMDMEVPGYSGPKIARLIRQYDNFFSIPIVFLSANQNPQSIWEAKQAGADDYFIKNSDISLLVDTIEYKVARYREIMRLINEDGLTRLNNHRSIMDILTSETQKSTRDKRPLTIAAIDLDYFKKVNDDYGHQSGDKVLKNLASLLQTNLRQHDAIGRIGGEEFLIILPKTPLLDAQKIIERLRIKFSALSHKVLQTEIQCTFSVGITSYQNQKDSITSFINRADENLYQAKAAGRNCTIAA